MSSLFKRMRLLGQSFQARLMLLLLLPLLVVWTVLALTSVSMVQRQQEFVGAQQETTAKRLADELNEKMQDRLKMLESIAASTDLAQWTGHQTVSDFLAQRYALRPMFSAGAIVFDLAGTVLGEYPVVAGRKGRNYSDREYLQRFYATGKPTISQPYLGRVRPLMLITWCVPLGATHGQVGGALCGNFDMRSTNFLGRLSDPRSMGSNGIFLIRNSDRVLIASTESSRVMTQMPDSPLMRHVSEGSGTAFVASSSEGIEKLYASAPVVDVGWTLVLALPTDIAYAPIRVAVDALKRDALLASLLVMLASYFLARRMLRPLQQAGNKMDAMSSGREPLQRVEETGDTEVRRLLTSFNRLSDSVVSQQTQLHDERNALLRAKGALHLLNQELETKVAQRAQKLMELNAFLHEVLEMLPFGVVVLDGQQHVNLRNQLFGTLLGYPEALLSKEPLQFADWMRFNFERGDFGDEALQDVLDRYTSFMESRQPMCFEWQQRNGVYLEVRGQPLANGWNLLTYTDITAHKQSERVLQQHKDRYQLLFDRLPEPCLIMSTDGSTVVDCNDATEGMLRGSRAQIIGMSAYQLSPPDQANGKTSAELGAQKVMESLRDGSCRFEWIHCRLDGEHFWADVTVSVIQIRGRQHFLVVLRDISDLKRAESQLTELNEALARQIRVSDAATEAKSAFIANMSQEIRTPMNAILGLSHLLEKSALPGDAHDMVVKMRMASTSLLGILNDVLDFSKIESGKLGIQSASFRLGDVLNNLATIMSANAQEKDLELMIAPAPSGTSQLIGDALRLEQVLINLTGNAIQFTERGHVALAISKEREEGAFLTLRFSVRDSGIGIAHDKQREIFAEAPQADALTSRTYGGSGLGLTISRRLVAAMGGELKVASVLGSGSEFWFELRLRRALDARVSAPEMAKR
jgi:PAS domain S-box-containing protein